MEDANSNAKPYWQHPSYKDKIRAEGERIETKWRIHYTSTSGEETIRTVEISHFLMKNDSGHILAHCLLRKEERAFYLGRIGLAYDLNLSKRIDDTVKHLKRIQTEQRITSYQRSMQNAIKAASELVDVLKIRRLENSQRNVKNPRLKQKR